MLIAQLRAAIARLAPRDTKAAFSVDALVRRATAIYIYIIEKRREFSSYSIGCIVRISIRSIGRAFDA